MDTRAYRGELPPQRFNMARYAIAAAAAATPDKPALIVVCDARQAVPAQVWTFQRLEQAVLAVAGALRAKGLRTGDRLMIRLENDSLYAVLFFGAIAAGLVPLPTSSQLTGREASFLLSDSGAAALAIARDLSLDGVPHGTIIIEAEEIARWPAQSARIDYADTAADDPAFLIYTSGTTASPKGVLHAQRAAWGRRPMYQGWYGIGPDDRVLHAGAFNWTYTLGTGLTDPWANGATAIVYTGPRDPALWPHLILQHEATLFAAVPTLYRQILKYAPCRPGDFGALRHALTAGEALASAMADEWQARTRTILYEALGMSELSTYVSSSPSARPKPGAVGRPQPGRCVVVLPVEDGTEPLAYGEIGLLAAHRSDPGLMLGYWNRPAEQAEMMRGDWFISGDLAAMAQDGYISHHGRANDLMKALGYRVSPLEIEAILAQHPAIAEVACAEVTVREDVSVIGAFIVLRDGSTADTDDIRQFAAEHLAHYKQPREYVLVSALPRTANGKLMRRHLQKTGSNVQQS